MGLLRSLLYFFFLYFPFFYLLSFLFLIEYLGVFLFFLLRSDWYYTVFLTLT